MSQLFFCGDLTVQFSDYNEQTRLGKQADQLPNVDIRYVMDKVLFSLPSAESGTRHQDSV